MMTSLMSVEANILITYAILIITVVLLLSKRYKYQGLLSLTFVMGTLNFRYGITKIDEAISFFVAIYDPFYNLGVEDGSLISGLAQCDGGSNNCTALPTRFIYHAAWGVPFFSRFTVGAQGANCAKLYAHIWCNSVALVLCLIQFHEPTRKQYPQFHKLLGFIITTLVCTGTWNALLLGSEHGDVDAYGGIKIVYGWYFMSFNVIICLFRGVYAIAIQKDLKVHKIWMIRFYGSMWGSFFIFRLIFFILGPLLRSYGALSILIATYGSAPIGIAISEYVRLNYLDSSSKSLKKIS